MVKILLLYKFNFYKKVMNEETKFREGDFHIEKWRNQVQGTIKGYIIKTWAALGKAIESMKWRDRIVVFSRIFCVMSLYGISRLVVNNNKVKGAINWNILTLKWPSSSEASILIKDKDGVVLLNKVLELKYGSASQQLPTGRRNCDVFEMDWDEVNVVVNK
jgi:hypothetical protein